MEKLLPSQFTEALGGIAFIVAVLLTLLSFVPAIRATALRLAAVLFLSTFALFANHWTTYFAAVFIIATAVTELEFLHILAAIIRGDKHYFEFRREFLTQEEAMRRAEETSVSEDPTALRPEPRADGQRLQIPENVDELSSQHRMHLAFQIQACALEWLERDLGKQVEQYVRYSSKDGVIELDGVVPGKRSGKDLVVEVKWIRHPRGDLRPHLERVRKAAASYKDITNRDCDVIALSVAPDKETIRESVLERTRTILKEDGVDYRLVVVTYAELGIETTSDSA